jgi:VWFA-related protein
VADVQVDAEVVDGQRQVGGLTQQDFMIFDENRPQQIVYFGHSSVPLEVVLLLDVSGSVQKYLKDIAAIATSALRKLTEQDQVAVMVFSRDTWIEQSMTNDPDEIAQAIEKAAHEQPFGSGPRTTVRFRHAHSRGHSVRCILSRKKPAGKDAAQGHPDRHRQRWHVVRSAPGGCFAIAVHGGCGA